jgi:hypothetical protein
MTFLNPWALILLPIISVPFLLKSSQGQVYSWLSLVPQDRISSIAEMILKIITSLLITSIVIALASPRGPDQQIRKTGKGAQTVMVIDRSVSMDHPFSGDSTSGVAAEIKSAAARRLITKFIDSRPFDMMGVVGFTNSALYGVKITTNREAIHSAINAATSSAINQTNIGSGLTEAIGLFDNIENSGSRAIILLSDGAGKISPRVKNKIKKSLESRKLNLYWIVLREPDDISIFSENNGQFTEGSEPAPIALDKFFNSLQIKYKAYEADNPAALQSAIQDIDVREKKKIQYSISIPGHDYSVDFIVIALFLSLLILIAKNLRVYSWQVE